jgi:dihydroorotate dehydrogenase
MYRFLFDLVLRRVDPERAHRLGKGTLQLARATSPGRALVRRWVGPPDPILAVRAWGLTFSSPLGVAAGLDKDASWYEDLLALGFGHVEVGTVTALPQAGNPAPRIVRVTDDRALINRMGFPGPGARAVAEHLVRPSRGPGVVGVNVGKSRAVETAAAAADYAESVRLLAPLADYININISSPNTPGLRQLQSPDQLRGLVTEVRRQLDQLGRPLPLLIKLAPDLEDPQLDQIAKLALELDLDGIVAVNTTVDRSGLRSDARRLQAFEGGGVSGRPLAPRAEQVLRRLRETVGPEGSRTPTMCGDACKPGLRSYRPTPGSSMEARVGRRGSTANWPSGRGRRVCNPSRTSSIPGSERLRQTRRCDGESVRLGCRRSAGRRCRVVRARSRRPPPGAGQGARGAADRTAPRCGQPDL